MQLLILKNRVNMQAELSNMLMRYSRQTWKHLWDKRRRSDNNGCRTYGWSQCHVTGITERECWRWFRLAQSTQMWWFLKMFKWLFRKKTIRGVVGQSPLMTRGGKNHSNRTMTLQLISVLTVANMLGNGVEIGQQITFWTNIILPKMEKDCFEGMIIVWLRDGAWNNPWIERKYSPFQHCHCRRNGSRGSWLRGATASQMVNLIFYCNWCFTGRRYSR